MKATIKLYKGIKPNNKRFKRATGNHGTNHVKLFLPIEIIKNQEFLECYLDRYKNIIVKYPTIDSIKTFKVDNNRISISKLSNYLDNPEGEYNIEELEEGKYLLTKI